MTESELDSCPLLRTMPRTQTHTQYTPFLHHKATNKPHPSFSRTHPPYQCPVLSKTTDIQPIKAPNQIKVVEFSNLLFGLANRKKIKDSGPQCKSHPLIPKHNHIKSTPIHPHSSQIAVVIKHLSSPIKKGQAKHYPPHHR